MVTLLDAHADISMCYELYPNLLEGLSVDDAKEAVSLLQQFPKVREAAKVMPTKGLASLVKWAPRARLSMSDLARIIEHHLVDGKAFEEAGDRFGLIRRIGVNSASVSGKRFWGAKCSLDFDGYREAFPNARYVNMIRDGRDVLSSQLNTGAFNPDPTALGIAWAKNHRKFRKFVDSEKILGYEVFYEELANNPKKELKKIFDFLEMPYDDSILKFNQQDLNIYEVGHISMPNLVNPINPSKIGRWKTDLSEEDLKGFMAVTSDAMSEFGYV